MLLTISVVAPMIGLVRTTATAKTERGENTAARSWIELPDPLPIDMILEQSVCRRVSFRAYTTTLVTDEELSTVLWAAYGVTASGGRTVYSPNGTYSTTIYVIRSDATYLYVPANHSLQMWKTGSYLYLGQDTNAPIKFGLVWNKSIASDEKAGMAEIGMIAQNVYFDANALNLATLTTGTAVADLYTLGLPSNEKPEIIMHLGHATTPYSFTYDPLPESNLPQVINNTLTLADAVTARQIVNTWNATELSLLEESQVLWCSYGSSYFKEGTKRHRTPPSAINIYPFKIYAANQTGVYQYAPATHSLSLVVSGDKRVLIQNALGAGNISVASAPLIIVPFWDKNVGSQGYLTWWWYESGAIVHNIFLEAAALNLSGNVVSVITDQNGLRSAVGVPGQTNLVPLHVVMVGRANQSSQNNPPLAPTLSGPSSGLINVLYNYTLVTTDPDGDDVYYYVDWSDGTNSGWVGPFPSGMMVTLNHTWTHAGSFTIKAKAKDPAGLESAWTPLVMTITQAGLAIEITGGFGITATIKNFGTSPVTNANWTISFSGGFAIPSHKSGMIPTIPISGQSKVQMRVFGVGRQTITVSVMADDGVSGEQTATGFLFVFFVLSVK